jgi:hypothetical protein
MTCLGGAIASVFAGPGLARVPAKRLRSVANRSIHPASRTVRGIQACTTAIIGADVNSWARLSVDSPSACQMSRARRLLARSRHIGVLRWENAICLRLTPKPGGACRRHGETDQPRSGFWRVPAGWTMEGVQRVFRVGSCTQDWGIQSFLQGAGLSKDLIRGWGSWRASPLSIAHLAATIGERAQASCHRCGWRGMNVFGIPNRRLSVDWLKAAAVASGWRSRIWPFGTRLAITRATGRRVSCLLKDGDGRVCLWLHISRCQLLIT